LVFFTGIEFVSNRLSVEKLEYDLESKWELTEAGLQMFATSPVIGIGHEGYRDNYKKYFPNSSKKSRPVHNIFIKVLAEYGLIGFIPFILIFIYPLLYSIKIYKIKKNLIQKEYLSDLTIFCISTIIPFMLMGWFAGGLYSNKYAFHIFYSNIALFIAFSHSILANNVKSEDKNNV
jgi:O-antigen ligase